MTTTYTYSPLYPFYNPTGINDSDQIVAAQDVIQLNADGSDNVLGALPGSPPVNATLALKGFRCAVSNRPPVRFARTGAQLGDRIAATVYAGEELRRQVRPERGIRGQRRPR